METQNTFDTKNEPKDVHQSNNVSGRIWSGLILVAVGLILLAREAGAAIPHWLVSWPMLLIVIGLFIGARHKFKNPAGFILILVGSIFLFNLIDPSLELGDYMVPVVVIVIGLIIIFKPKRTKTEWEKPYVDPYADPNLEVKASLASNIPLSGEDYLDSVTIFGGVKKNIVSKTFRGGELVTIFGGTEINFSQADVSHTIVLDITQIFGGAKLIVPPHWKIQSEEIVSIFGSVEDKRPVLPDSNYDSGKVLILKGTNIFGGIDIKSF